MIRDVISQSRAESKKTTKTKHCVFVGSKEDAPKTRLVSLKCL